MLFDFKDDLQNIVDSFKNNFFLKSKEAFLFFSSFHVEPTPFASLFCCCASAAQRLSANIVVAVTAVACAADVALIQDEYVIPPIRCRC